MELKKFLEKVKSTKEKDVNLKLTLTILSLEENLIEISDKKLLIAQLGDLLKYAFNLVIEHKLNLNNKDVKDLDLDHWKNNIKAYRTTNANMNKDVFLYSLRNSLKNILENKDDMTVRIFLFELIIKSFLYIDYLDLSIDTILDLKSKSIKK